MKYSKTSIKTQKETPANETAQNAQLLIKAGFIHKTMAGAYSFLPMGLRVLNKISNIVREEMEAVNAEEILMSSLVPKENWEKTGRWNTVDVLYKMKTHGNEIAFSPTHEEIVTPLIQGFLNSYKDFPKCVYQIQTKFRNEARAKSGLLRGREFLMKDAYSFHTSQECFEKYYAKMTEAYHKIYARLGIGAITKFTYASGGDFSKYSHEFQTISEIGEDELYYIKSEDKYLNKEIVQSKAPPFDNSDEKMAPLKEILGKGIVGVKELEKFLGIPVEKSTKTILFETKSKKVYAAAVRGDYDICENKLQEIIGESFKLANEETIKEVTGAEVGYAGILGLSDEVTILFDESCDNRINWETGSNKTDYHTINVNWGRDIQKPKQFYDFKIPKPGDLYPKTGEAYQTMKAVEVGNIFPLSTKFSNPFKFTALGQNGKPQEVIMGCYGIGISRLMGIIAEIFGDKNGLVWPENIAPYKVYLAPIGKNNAVYEKSQEIYEELKSTGIEVFYDNRKDKKIGPGQKFADADLMGIPYQLILSERLLENKNIEIITRKTGEKKEVSIEKIPGILKK